MRGQQRQTVVMVHGYDHDPDHPKHSATAPGGVFTHWAQELHHEEWAKYAFEWYSGRKFKDHFRARRMKYRTSYGWAYSVLAPMAGERLARLSALRGADVICHSLGSLAVLHALAVKPNFFRRVIFLNGAATVADAVPIIKKNEDVTFLNINVETDSTLSWLGAWFEPRLGRHDTIGQAGLRGQGLHHLTDVQLDNPMVQAHYLDKGYDLNGDNPDRVSDHKYSYLFKGNWDLYREFLRTGKVCTYLKVI